MNPSDTWETAVTADDQAYYQQLYQYEGANKSQDDMTPFLRKAQAVSTQQLNQILGAAFQANTSNVDVNKKSFYIALKLIACAQHGINPSSPILSTSTPLPTFEEYEIITSKDRQKYLRIFQASGPTDGLINGENAMKILMRSKLPVSLLSQIWNLADIDRQGKLDSTGFVIAMHYVAKCMNGNQKSLPHANAPDSILISARGESPSLATMTTPKHSPSPRSTGKHGPTSPPPSTTQTPLAEATNEHPDVFSPLHHQQPWIVDDAELASYTDSFNNIDTRHKGYIEGSEAVSFFGHSKLPSSVLAGIWDLADTQNRGQLSQDEFAIAMHLIRRVRGGSSLPTTLPASLLSHVDAGKQKTLAKQADKLKQSIDNEEKDVTALQQSVKEQDTVVSDLLKQVDALEQSLQQVVNQKTDLQTTLDTLKRTENEKRHKIAQLEKEYNTTQTELDALKTAHQQRLALVGISNSQLASAQSLKDKSAEELALAQNGKFDTFTESYPKANDAPPPPPPSSRHHRTQSLRAQSSPGSSSKKPPAPPPSKKKRAPVPSTPSAADTITKELSPEKSLAAAVSAGVTSVVASSALIGLINSPSPVATALNDTPLEAHHEEEPVVDDMEHTQALPDTSTNAPTDERDVQENNAAELESHKAIDEAVLDESNKNVKGNNNDILDTQSTTIPDEPTANDELTAAPINKDDTTEDANDSPLDVNTADNLNITKNTPSEANITSDATITDNAKAVSSEINDTDNTTDAKEEPSGNIDIDTAAKELPGEAGVVNDTVSTKDVPNEVSGDEDATMTADASKEVTKEIDDTATAAEAPKEITNEIDDTTDTNDTQQQSTTADEDTDGITDATSDLVGLTDTDGTSKATEVPSGVTETSKSNDGLLPTPVNNIGDEKGQVETAAKDTETNIVENDDQPVTATITPEVKKDVDTTSSGDRTDTDSGDADVPNGSPVVVEPIDSGNKNQPLVAESRTNTGSPEIHTATTTASGSLKGDDHDFEVVDNASASSSFMSASMGGGDDALDEFDAAFSETLPDARMVLSNTADPNTVSTSGTTTTVPPSNTTASGYDKHFYDDDDFDQAFDPKVFTPTAAIIHSDQHPDLGQQIDASQPKNDPFAVHDTSSNNSSFADAFAPFVATSTQQDASTNSPSAFDDSFTIPQPQASTGSTTIGTRNEPVATNATLAPEFMDLKNLVVSPEQVAEYESNPFDEPSFEHPPDGKDQQGLNEVESDRPIDNQPTSEQLPQESITQQPTEPAPVQQSVEQFIQPAQTPTIHQIERESFDNIQAIPHQLPTSARQDDIQANLRAPPTVSPSVSTTSNAQSDRQSQQSQQSQQRPATTAAAGPVGTKPADEGHTTPSSKGKHKGLFSLSSMLPKQKGKKNKNKSSKKEKSSGGYESMAQQQQQQPPPQSPTTMQQQYQDPSLENTIPALSDQEVMANLRDFGIDSESMKTLTNMGFTVDQAKEALQRYDQDVSKATNYLLDQ